MIALAQLAVVLALGMSYIVLAVVDHRTRQLGYWTTTYR